MKTFMITFSQYLIICLCFIFSLQGYGRGKGKVVDKREERGSHTSYET